MKPNVPVFRIPTIRLTADVVMYAIAIANAFRIGWAYAYVDANGNFFSIPGISGALLGAALSIGTAYVAGKVPSVKGKTRTLMTWIGLGLILALEPVILAPLSVSDMPERLKATLPGGWPWLWGITAALLPSLVLASISFANGSLVDGAPVSQPEARVNQSKADKSQPVAEVSQPEPAQSQPVAEVSQFVCASCGYEAKSQAALNAHQVKHKPQTSAQSAGAAA